MIDKIESGGATTGGEQSHAANDTTGSLGDGSSGARQDNARTTTRALSVPPDKTGKEIICIPTSTIEYCAVCSSTTGLDGSAVTREPAVMLCTFCDEVAIAIHQERGDLDLDLLRAAVTDRVSWWCCADRDAYVDDKTPRGVVIDLMRRSVVDEVLAIMARYRDLLEAWNGATESAT